MRKLVFARFQAFVVDCLLLAVVVIPAMLLLSLAYANVRGESLWEILVFGGSIPAWLYFFMSDRRSDGATFGKRFFKIQVRTVIGAHLDGEKAALRTVGKMLPWELFNFLVFAMAPPNGSWGRLQTVGAVLAGLLLALYAITTVVTGGQRSFYDILIESQVRFTKPPRPGTANPQRRGSKVIMAGRRHRKARR